eukprot:SAG11_NODE_35956_length_264_cov_0.630303_1_plen_31_part_10
MSLDFVRLLYAKKCRCFNKMLVLPFLLLLSV